MLEPPRGFPTSTECPAKSSRAAVSLTDLIVVLAVCARCSNI